jgi:hypothetical protein
MKADCTERYALRGDRPAQMVDADCSAARDALESGRRQFGLRCLNVVEVAPAELACGDPSIQNSSPKRQAKG